MQHWTEFNNYEPKIVNYRKGRKTVVECNDIFTLDIETTSYWHINGKVTGYKSRYTEQQYNNAKKGAMCYIWQFSVNDNVYYGRYLDELPKFIDMLNALIPIGCEKFIFVHNLSYELQFLREYLTIDNATMFCRTARKPMKFCANGFEFRCTYMLTHLSLATWGDSIGIKKKVGDLDYNVLRTPKTQLTQKELSYCEYDCKVVYNGVKKFREKYDHIGNIPLTQTGEVRRVIKALFKGDKSYNRYVTSLQPQTLDDYKDLRAAFGGGSTGACYLNAGHIVTDLGSFDLISDYPSQVVKQKFPCTPFVDITGSREVKKLDFDKNAYILTIEFHNLKSKTPCRFLSKSRCHVVQKGTTDNGKLINAELCIATMTEQDYLIMSQTYNWNKRTTKFLKVKKSKKAYLDKRFIECVLMFYCNKTKLKDVAGQGELYMQSKQFVNSLYGLMVTDLLQPEIIYDENGTDLWSKHEVKQCALDEIQCKPYKNFTAYQWGVWVTAYARKELWEVLVHVDKDVVYYDTDSCKYKNINKYWQFFEDKNKVIEKQVFDALKHHKIDTKKAYPLDIKGNKHMLGIWDYEGKGIAPCYKAFITLGAKRYCYIEQDNSLHITISGVPKKASCALTGIEDFKEGLEFSKDLVDDKGEYISKKLSTYIDGDNYSCIVNLGKYDEYVVTNKNSINMRNNGYKLSLADEYRTLINIGKDKNKM